MPSNIENIHAFAEDYMKIIEFNSKNNLNLLSLGKYGTYKSNLLKAQDSLCHICQLTITPEHITMGAVHIFHLKPIFKKGLRNKMENMKIVHS
jgi:hypothetical protein